MSKYDLLLSPFKLGNLTLKNRIISAPTSLAEMGSGGVFSPENIAYFELRAKGGAALVNVGEAVAHGATGPDHPSMVILDNPTAVPSMYDLVSTIHKYGAYASIEFGHGGKRCNPAFLPGHVLPVGPCDIFDDQGNQTVRGMDRKLMDDVIGAVFMAQSMTEIMGGMQALTNTLALSLLLVALLMLPIVLFFASRMVRPISRMRTVALTMAGGDLTVRAEDASNDEYGELGRALNYLSSELGRTISSLQMERNRLQSLINGLSEGIIAVDEKGATTLINPAVYNLLNLDSNANHVRAAAPDVFAMFDEALSSAQAVKKTIWQGDVALHISVSPLLTQSGEVSGCVGIVSDVTSAERLEQTRRDYVANVSHELRTPLTAMRALIEPLRDGLVKTEEQRQQIYDVVLRETMRLSRLVNDMLELSRLQSGTASLSRSVFAPLPLLDLIHETYSAYAEDYQQTFVYDVPKDLPNVVGNPDRTQQVLIALLDNAFKYTPEGGTVTLSACTEDQVVRIRVTDTGVGIPAADLPHVFDRFYKVDKSHHSKGTGLGLAIAYEIMKHLGEEMSVTSEPGKGSCFTFTLHMADEKETPAQ